MIHSLRVPTIKNFTNNFFNIKKILFLYQRFWGDLDRRSLFLRSVGLDGNWFDPQSLNRRNWLPTLAIRSSWEKRWLSFTGSTYWGQHELHRSFVRQKARLRLRGVYVIEVYHKSKSSYFTVMINLLGSNKQIPRTRTKTGGTSQSSSYMATAPTSFILSTRPGRLAARFAPNEEAFSLTWEVSTRLTWLSKLWAIIHEVQKKIYNLRNYEAQFISFLFTYEVCNKKKVL